jgi:hypothetical protein
VSDDWDPTPDQRTYYRSAEDGQRAYLVKRGGKDMVRLDRPMEEILRPLDGSWRPDTQTYPFTAHQVAEVAFAADRALCRTMGKHLDAGKEWLSLKEQARIKWMEEGPSTGDIRDDLYDAIMGTLKGMTDG